MNPGEKRKENVTTVSRVQERHQIQCLRHMYVRRAQYRVVSDLRFKVRSAVNISATFAGNIFYSTRFYGQEIINFAAYCIIQSVVNHFSKFQTPLADLFKIVLFRTSS